jgi:hypothetical protein
MARTRAAQAAAQARYQEELNRALDTTPPIKPAPSFLSQIFTAIKIGLTVLFLGPLIIVFWLYGNASKQRRVLTSVRGRTYYLDLNVATPTCPFKLNDENGRVVDDDFIRKNIPYEIDKFGVFIQPDGEEVSEDKIKNVNVLGETKTDEELQENPEDMHLVNGENMQPVKFLTSEQVWSQRGLSKMAPAPGGDNFFWCYQSLGEGGYEAQYLQAKSVRNYRAYVILASVVSKMRAAGVSIAPGTFPLIKLEIGPVGDIRGKQFPAAGFEEVRAYTSPLILAMSFANDRRSGRSTYSPIRDCFLYSVPAASDAQSDVHAYAEALLNTPEGSTVKKQYERALISAPNAALFFRREHANFWNQPYVNE